MCKAGTGAVPTDISFGSGDTLAPPRLCKQLHRCVEAWKLCCWCIIFQAHGCCCKGYWKHGSLSKHTALPLQARDGCCCPGWRHMRGRLIATPSQSHYHHGSPVSAAWQRHLLLCCFGRSFATITSCQVRAATLTANNGVASSQPVFSSSDF